MYLARVQPGIAPQVYHLTDVLCVSPRSWVFASYGRGACAIGYTSAEAVQAARRRLEMPRAALRVSAQRGAW
jgi:hypothetical protein